MSAAAALAGLLSLVLAAPSGEVAGRVVDARTGAPVPGTEVAIAGGRGAVRTDETGRFRWPFLPALPIDVIAVLPDGRVARPIRISVIPPGGELLLAIAPARNEFVSVTGIAPSIDAAPAAATTRIAAMDVEARHARTLADVLDTIPGIATVSEGQAAVPAIRGLARGRTLILVDGSRASTERRAGANASFFDPATARSVQVARGPGSVAYGSDAFGGVIAAETRGPDHAVPLRIRFAGTLGRGVPERRADLEVSTGYGSGGLLVAVRARSIGDYSAPGGVVPNSGWQDRGVRARWEKTTAGSFLAVGWQSDAGRDLGRPRSDSGAIRVRSPFEHSHRLTLSYERASVGGFRSVRINALGGASRQRNEQERLPAPGRPRSVERGDLSSREVQVRATAARPAGRARLHVGADLQGRYGLEATDITRRYTLAGSLASEAVSVSIDSARRTSGGLFVEAELPAGRGITASGGLRAEAVTSTNEGGFFGRRTVAHAAPAGLAALTLTPGPRVSLTLQAARGFRDPTLSDRFYRGPSGRGFIEGNPVLRPETSLQFDAMARYTAGPVRLSASAYRYRISNLVERHAATPDLFRFRNRGRAVLRGVEAELQAALPGRVTLAAGAEASRGRDAADGSPLDDIAPAAVSAVLRRGFGERGTAYTRIAAIAPHRAAGPGEVPTPGYTLAEAGGSWRLTPRLRLHGSLHNLLNAAYPSSAGPRWVRAAGRSASVTAAVTFQRSTPPAGGTALP